MKSLINRPSFYPLAGALTGAVSAALIIQLEDYLRPIWVRLAEAAIPMWPYFGGASGGMLLGCIVLLFKPTTIRD